MINICILVPDGAVMQAVADPHYLFTTVNHFLIADGRAPVFEVQFAGMQPEIQLNNGLYSVKTDRIIDESWHPDIIIVPATRGDFDQIIATNKPLADWIVSRYQTGSQIASLCLGAFLLASTGLLDNRKCSTHWGFTDDFTARFPNVQMVEGLIITEDKGIYTSGGAHSYWNLLLYLVEKTCDRHMAIRASKYFAIDIDRVSQSPFTIFKGQKQHNDPGIKIAQDFIESNVNDRITIDQLASIAAVGRRTFERRFRQATGNSVLSYIQRVKMEAAKRALEVGHKNVNEVMYDVGYTDVKAFRTVFRKITGLTPQAYRNKYNRIHASQAA
jgi:transcriptional regulator GlxA family with amidase domain